MLAFLDDAVFADAAALRVDFDEALVADASEDEADLAFLLLAADRVGAGVEAADDDEEEAAERFEERRTVATAVVVVEEAALRVGLVVAAVVFLPS